MALVVAHLLQDLHGDSAMSRNDVLMVGGWNEDSMGGILGHNAVGCIFTTLQQQQQQQQQQQY